MPDSARFGLAARQPWAWAWLAAWMTGVGAGNVAAQAEETHQATLQYERAPNAEACPDQRELENAVAARLGYVPFVADADEHMEVRVARKGARFTAKLRFETAGATGARVRELSSRGRDCAELTAAMALALSLAIDPMALTRPAREPVAPEPEPVAPPPPPPVVVPEPPPPPPPEPAPVARQVEPAPRDPRELLHGFLAIGGAGVLGAAPGPTAGVALAFGVRRERVALGIEARVDVSREREVASVGKISAASRLVGGSLCYLPASWARLCGVGALALVQAEGQGLPATRSGLAFHGLVGARVGGELTLPERLFLRADLDTDIALGRIRFQLAGREIWETSRLQGALLLSFGKYL